MEESFVVGQLGRATRQHSTHIGSEHAEEFVGEPFQTAAELALSIEFARLSRLLLPNLIDIRCSCLHCTATTVPKTERANDETAENDAQQWNPWREARGEAI